MAIRSGQSPVTTLLLLHKGIFSRVKHLSSVQEAKHSQGAPGLRNSSLGLGRQIVLPFGPRTNRAHPFVVTFIANIQMQCDLETNKLYHSHYISLRKNDKTKFCPIVTLLNTLLSGVVLSRGKKEHRNITHHPHAINLWAKNVFETVPNMPKQIHLW